MERALGWELGLEVMYLGLEVRKKGFSVNLVGMKNFVRIWNYGCFRDKLLKIIFNGCDCMFVGIN